MTDGAPRFEVRQADWLSVDEAAARILAAANPLEVEEVRVELASGRALAEDIVATATLPPWDNSAMDGYAVRGDDIGGAQGSSPVRLRVDGAVRAGDTSPHEVRPGTAIRIMTGAPIPPGADSVVRVEDTDREADEGHVQILDDRDRGRNIRAAGQDMREGSTLLRAGDSITPGMIGVLAAAGRGSVSVCRRPRVGILATGDELRRVDHYDDVRNGLGVPESNGVMLAAMSRATGAEPVDLGVARDDREELEARLARTGDVDVLVTSGGASMGEADLIKRVLDDMGFEQSFWRVKMRPGSPIGFGWLLDGERRLPVFSLPGNPSSAFVTFEVFVRPFLLRLAGHDRVGRRTVTCTASERFDTPAPLTYFQRVVVEEANGELRARLTGPQLSGLVRGLAFADGLAVIEPERAAVDVGSPVSVMLIDPSSGGHAARIRAAHEE